MEAQLAPPDEVPAFAAVPDARGAAVDLAPIRVVLQRMVSQWRPRQIWLFGSRSRGEALSASDWDLFAVVPDDMPEDSVGPMATFRLRKESGLPIDVVACHLSDFGDSKDTPNTLAYEVTHGGVLLYER